MSISNLLARAAQLCPHVMMLSVAALCLTLGAGGPSYGQDQILTANYSPRPITIGNDMGGDVGARANRIAAMRASGQSVAIRGPSCYSACTMYLSLPGSCVSRKAKFGFHRPSYYGSTLPPEKFEFWSRIIAAHYPAPLQSWYMAEGRHSVALQMISGTELIRLGVTECG